MKYDFNKKGGGGGKVLHQSPLKTKEEHEGGAVNFPISHLNNL